MYMWKLVQMGRYLSIVLKQCKIITGPSYKNGSVPGHSCCYIKRELSHFSEGHWSIVVKCSTFYYLATFMFKIKLTSHIEVIYVLIIYLLKIQIFFHPWYEYVHVVFITPPLRTFISSLVPWPCYASVREPGDQVTLYHTPFWNTSVFFMQITSRFFRFNAYNTNVINGDKIIRFGVFFFQKQMSKWRQINNQVASYLTLTYIICFHTYTVVASKLPELYKRRDFIVHLSFQSKQWRFVLTI